MDDLEWELELAQDELTLATIDDDSLLAEDELTLETIDDDSLRHIFQHMHESSTCLRSRASALLSGHRAAWDALGADAAASAVCVRFAQLMRPRLEAWRDACQDAVLGDVGTGVGDGLDADHSDGTAETAAKRHRAWFATSDMLLLHGCSLTDLHVRLVAPLLLRPGGSPPLRALWLQDNQLGDASLFALARAASRGAFLSLETLNMGGQEARPVDQGTPLEDQPPRFTAAGLGALLGATVPAFPPPAGRRPALASLVRLLVPSLLLGDKEAGALAEAFAAGGLPSLVTLRISNNRVGDAGARELVYALPQLANFLRLEWANNLVVKAAPSVNQICAHMMARKAAAFRPPACADQGMPEEEAARLSALALGSRAADGVARGGASPPFAVAPTPLLAVRGMRSPLAAAR